MFGAKRTDFFGDFPYQRQALLNTGVYKTITGIALQRLDAKELTLEFHRHIIRWSPAMIHPVNHPQPEIRISSKLPDVGTTIFTVMSQLAAECDAINLSQGFPDFQCPERLRERLPSI